MLNARDGMFLDLISTNPYLSCSMRVFRERFFFKRYAAPSKEAFVWPSFHFHNFTQRFFLFWLAQLAERRSAGREVAGSNPGRTNTQGL